MRVFFVLISFILFGCGSDDPGFTSAVGEWTYTTPGGNITVVFNLAGGDTELFEVQNQTIFVDGVEGKAEAELVNIDLLNIRTIRINANDVDLVFPYNVRFENLTVSSDFTKINAKEGSYTYPWGTANTLTDVEIVRK